MNAGMDEAAGLVLAQLCRDAAAWLEAMRRERDQLAAAGEDTAWIERRLAECEPIAKHLAAVQTDRALFRVVQWHGGGPRAVPRPRSWPFDRPRPR
ncbi:hypothetical protein ACIBHY_54060 [Nonomuraea sp. NPDC050547]|uniref:hypothetical protein n=1 Tax=Nonomuraea sp. NPDC050547 TaxID=3364368 RepID=UPI00378C39A7